MNEQFFNALADLVSENEIDREVLIEKIRDAIIKAIKKETGTLMSLRTRYTSVRRRIMTLT